MITLIRRRPGKDVCTYGGESGWQGFVRVEESKDDYDLRETKGRKCFFLEVNMITWEKLRGESVIFWRGI